MIKKLILVVGLMFCGLDVSLHAVKGKKGIVVQISKAEQKKRKKQSDHDKKSKKNKKNKNKQIFKNIEKKKDLLKQQNPLGGQVSPVNPDLAQNPDPLGGQKNDQNALGSKIFIGASWAPVLWFAGRAVYKQYTLLSKETEVMKDAEINVAEVNTVAKKFRAVAKSAVKKGKLGLTALAQTSKAIYAKPKKYKKLLGSTGFAAVVTAAVVSSK